MRRAMQINPEAAEESRARTEDAMDRLEREISPSGFLAGDSFSVADLTAASLFYPVVLPAEFPYPMVSELPDSAREFLEPLARRPGAAWVREMYRCHRGPSAEDDRSPAAPSVSRPGTV
jgi:glutathione S-transferase